MVRPLGNMEQALTLMNTFAPLTVVAVLGLRNAPPPERLRSALDILQRRKPLLRARIERGTWGGYRFAPTEQPIPLEVLERQGDGHWQLQAERSLNTRLAASEGPLMACTYLHPEPSGGAGELCFSFHHAAIDAVSGLELLHELLEVIRDLQDGVPVAAESLEPAASVERYLPPRATALPRTLGYLWRQLQDAGRVVMAVRGERRAPLHLAARCRLLTVEIDADITRQLVQRSRRQRLGLASLLAAAMLLAVHRHLYAGASRPLRNVYFVDLRPHLEPPVASQDLGCYIAMLRLTAGLHASEDPAVALWRLARGIHEDVYRAAKRGDKFVAATTTRQAIQMALTFKNQRLGATALSYAGPAPLQTHYGDIQVEKLHTFVSNNVLGPEYTGQARLLNGVLGLDIVYLDEDMESDTAESIAESMVELLHLPVAS